MPGNPTDCLKHAARCRELADAAPNQEAKEAFLDLASTWEQLAAELASAHVFLQTMQQLEVKEVALTAEPPLPPRG